MAVASKKKGGSMASTLVFLSLFVVCVAIGVVSYMSKVSPAAFKLKPTNEVLESNDLLSTEHQLLYDGAESPALSFAVHPVTKQVYVGTQDGEIGTVTDGKFTFLARTGDKKRVRTGFTCAHPFFKSTCGQPVDMAFDREGLRLIVADAYMGLLSIDVTDGNKEILVNSGLKNIGNLAISQHSDIIYFTESSTEFWQAEELMAVMESKPTGRLLSYDFNTGAIAVVSKSLYFPTGLSIVTDKENTHDEYIVIVEKSRARLKRFWLPTATKEKKRGKADVFSATLPCVPNHISQPGSGRAQGSLLVSCMPRDSFNYVSTFAQYPSIRSVLAGLPTSAIETFLTPSTGLVLEISAYSGSIMNTYADASSNVGTVSTVKRLSRSSAHILTEVGGQLYKIQLIFR